MGPRNRYSPEVKERAVRLVLEHEREHELQWRRGMGLKLVDHPAGSVGSSLNSRT